MSQALKAGCVFKLVVFNNLPDIKLSSDGILSGRVASQREEESERKHETIVGGIERQLEREGEGESESCAKPNKSPK